MRIFSRLGAAVGLFLVFGLACKDSGAPAVTASNLSRVSGDSQATLTGDSLNAPLMVAVTGSQGQPIRGATVTWAVTAGAATLGSPTAASDSQGYASTTVTLGATPGAISIQASVGNGIPPVTFGATACDHPVLAFNDTIPGALAASDCKFSGFFTDFYDVSVATGPQGLELTMASGAFDTWLELYRRTGAFLGYDDDIDSSNTNSQLTAILGPGQYLLAPSSYQPLITGSYTMAALTQPVGLTGCKFAWVTRGVAISDSVTAADCVDSTSGVYYADVVAIYLTAGTTLIASNQSTAFDAALFLHNAAGTSVASNNDSANAGTTTNAYLVYPVTASGPYLLYAGTNTTSSTGAYTLSISSATTWNGSARLEQGGGRQLLRLGGLRMPKARFPRAWSRTGT